MSLACLVYCAMGTWMKRKQWRRWEPAAIAWIVMLAINFLWAISPWAFFSGLYYGAVALGIGACAYLAYVIGRAVFEAIRERRV